jgi:hypothetical protein
MGDNLFAGLWSGGVYISTNNGQSWSSANSGLTSNIVITLTVNGTNIYAGTTAGLFKSTDNGNSWNTVNSGLGTTYILFLYSFNSYLFAGTYNGGVYESSNGGANWINISTGLQNLDDRALTVFNSNLYVATVGGVWKRPLSEIVSVKQISNLVPDEFKLEQNYPNPFNPTTIIRFQVKDSRFVTLKVYDILGKEKSTIVNKDLNAGSYSYSFDASNLSSGVYFYKLTSGSFSDVKRMVIIK